MTADAIADGPEPEDDETPQPREHARLGEYRLVQRLGEGGMGVVHLALDRHGRAVAIKVLRQHIAHDPDARARLTREVSSLSRITSPRVAPIIDADVDGPTPYIVTRYVPGPSLDDHVAERGLLPPADLHRVASGLAEALDAIHSAGVVHRDVKPGNVLLVDGDPVLIDFGIAHVADDIRLTMTGLVMGTPGYLAPEVVGGEDVTPATDWWGWAATTAFAASGTPPFGTGPMGAVLARVSAGDPDLEAVDPRIEPLLYAALSPNPAERPTTTRSSRRSSGTPTVRRSPRRSWCAGCARRPSASRCRRPPRCPLPPPPPSRPPVAPVIGAAAGAGRAVRAGMPAAASAAPARRRAVTASPLPAPMVTTGRPAGPPGWEQAQPVNRPAAQSPMARPAPAPQQLAPAPSPVPGRPVAPGAPVPDSESDWDAARLGHGPYGDPRIGRPSRSGTLLALLAVLAAVTARAPVVAVLGLLAWVTLARTADRSVTALVMRRHERGTRGSDVAVAVATSPWHLVLGLLGAAATLVFPLFVGVCAMFASALVLTAARGTDVRTDDVLPLVVAGVFAGLTAWWGPGGASLRRGSRSIVRGLTPGEAAGQVAAGILLVVAVVVLAMTLTGTGPTWWPRTTAPGWASQVVPTL